MKIAILTQPLHANYGGILQAYAVQKILKDMGHEVETLDTPWPEVARLSILEQLRIFFVTLICYILGRIKKQDIYRPFNNNARNKRLIRLSMRPFINKIIRLSSPITSDKEIKDYFISHGFDACIVGSDQVWRPRYSPNIGWFFLSFLPDDYQIKRIALSASFGTSEWEFTNHQTFIFASLAKKFNKISVREQSGVELCNKYLKVDAKQLIDPTMMLTPNDYAELVNMDWENTTSVTNCAFSYILDETKEKLQTAEYIATILKKKIKVQKIASKIPPYASEKNAMYYAPKPLAQWLRSFQNTDFVVTDSFHGTVFSILYHRPFVVIANKERGLARIETLLKNFGLMDRLIGPEALCKESWLLHNINWKQVDIILSYKRTEFNQFLIDALK